MSQQNVQLIVLADDWGRHPSSCQHLVRHALAQRPGWRALWVNTIGMRSPRLTAGDARRAAGKLAGWLTARPDKPQTPQAPADYHAAPTTQANHDPAGLHVISPLMYPGFRAPWQRRLNAAQMARAIHAALAAPPGPAAAKAREPGDMRDPGDAPDAPPRNRIAMTTLPIAADLLGRLRVDRWVYYCVDDFSVWPGTDQAVMDAMERKLVAGADEIICAGETLQKRIADMGRDSTLLTHGIDLDMWRPANDERLGATTQAADEKKVALFWGLLDARMQWDWLAALADAGMHVRLIGPRAVEVDRRFEHRPPVAHHALPALAAEADVLIMPYVDAPVTHAMQPLKLKEYLATMKPVIVRDLPATRPWADCCDLVGDADAFVRTCQKRMKMQMPPEQREARAKRLPAESWADKAAAMVSRLSDAA